MRCALIALLSLVSAGCGSDKQPQSAASSAPTSSPSSDPQYVKTLNAKWTGDLDGIKERRLVRALVHPSKLQFFYDGAEPRGITAESMRELEKFINDKLGTAKRRIMVLVVPVRGDELVTALLDGRGDLIVGGMTVTDERARQVAFSTPLADNLDKVVVAGPASPALNSIDDLAGKELYYRTSHSFHHDLQQLNERFVKAGRPPMTLKAADENLLDDDIYEMVSAGLIPLTVGERNFAELWAQVFDGLKVRTDLTVKAGDKAAWALRKDSPRLLEVVNEFIAGHRLGTSFGNTLLRRYLKDVKWVTNARSDEELKKYEQTIQFFKQYGQKYDMDYLLMAAQGYQESRLDQKVKSPAGAVGVMQIKPTTAADPPISIKGVDRVENNIHAGVKYIRFIADEYYKNEPMDHLNKSLFAVASYNAGPARIQKLRDKAAEQGLDPNKWFENVEVVAAKEIGRETVQYVANIYKYYVTYKLIEDERAKRQKAKVAAAGKK